METKTGGNAVNQEEFVVTNNNNNNEVEDATTGDEVKQSSTNSASNPSNHPMSLNLSVPVRYLYHEQAKSIIAIQVGINQFIIMLEYRIMKFWRKKDPNVFSFINRVYDIGIESYQISNIIESYKE